MKEGYFLSGRHIDSFINFSSSNGLVFCRIDRKDGENVMVEISPSQSKLLQRLAHERAIKLDKIRPSNLENIKIFLRRNIAFVITAIIILALTLSSHFFIFDIKIYGLENVKRDEVIGLLQNNGYHTPRLKNQMDMDKICHLIKNNFDLVSYTSAIIIGNCLIINISEKIDTSSYIYDYPPIICPIDCIIEEISLTSGTKLKYAGDTTIAGEEVIAPYLFSSSNDKIPTPAKAEIVARYNLSCTFVKEEDNNLFEKNRNMLYNKLSNLTLISPTDEIVTTLCIEGVDYYTISLTGRFTFSR